MAPVEPTGTEPVSASAAPLTVEVAVSIAPRQVQRVRLQVPAGSTVRDALLACGLMTQVPGLTPEAVTAGQWAVGVWGRKERLGHPLHDQDRIELVRQPTGSWYWVRRGGKHSTKVPEATATQIAERIRRWLVANT